MQIVRYGNAGLFVRYLQLALKRAGYDTLVIDGVFGARTLQAVTAFQRENGLNADGIVGRRTWGALYPYLAGYTVRQARAGDTFYLLAERYDTTIERILTANPEIRPDAIPVGAELIIPLAFSVVPSDVPYSSMLNAILLDGLSARYPFLAVRRVGVSVMGRPLAAVTMGAGEKQVFYNAAHHANEWITSTLTMTYLERYCEAYVSGRSIGGYAASTLFERCTLFLLPLVNPDGVDLVTGALNADDSYYRRAETMSADYPSIPFPSGWKANIAGVDLNLQYPAGWEEAKRIKFAAGYTRPGPRDFVGTAPLTEPEARAVYEFTRDADFQLTLSYHTQGGVIYYKYLNFDPPRADEIALAFSAASGYEALETPFESGFAGYKDWFIQTYDRPGFTIEAGYGASPLPLMQFPSIYRDNEGIMTLGMALV